MLLAWVALDVALTHHRCHAFQRWWVTRRSRSSALARLAFGAA